MEKKIIVFEGIDGAGKTSQAKILSRKLTSEYYPVTLSHSPSKTIRGDFIKNNLSKWDARKRIVKFTEDLEKTIKEIDTPLIIFDRYTYSSIANYLGELPLGEIRNLISEVPIPDICFFINISYELVAIRTGYNPNEVHHDKNTQEKKYRNYINSVTKFPEVICINGAVDTDTISNEVYQILFSKVLKKIKRRNCNEK